MSKEKEKTVSKKPAANKAFKRAPMVSLANAKIIDLASFYKPDQMENFMNKGKNQFEKLSENLSSGSREMMEAVNKTIAIASKGSEDMFREAMAIAQEAAEKNANLTKQAMSSKTLNEWMETVNKIKQTNFDDCMVAVTKLSEKAAKVYTECSEPLNGQMTKTMKKATEAMAA
jgi:hypothetical protein